jgi:hypothetical protein
MFALPLVYMEAPVSVSRLSRGSSIKLYPNPSSSSISVRSSVSLVSRSYRVYNLQGAVVSEGLFGDSGAIPTANLPNGTYFLQLDGEKSRNITSKFIVQH